MNLNDLIYRRKSTRSYTNIPVDDATIQKIQEFTTTIKPLYPDIKVRSEIVSRENVKCICPWTTPQLITIFTEDKEGALVNVGFMFQQLDLYLHSIGLGVCWLGMGKLSAQGIVETKNDDGLEFVMMLAFGEPKGELYRSSTGEFKRKSLAEISDEQDERLEPARFAPSSVNSQPWYFTHEGDTIHAYCALQGFLKAKTLGDMNQIDMGIALAHMYVANEDTFRFFKADGVKELKGYAYIGTFTI